MKNIVKLFCVATFMLLLVACVDDSKKPSLTIDEKEKTLKILEEYELDYKLENSDSEVIVTVSDSNVLLLDGFSIKPIKIGNADVIFKTKDNKLSATLSVTVIARSFTISGEKNLIVGDSALLSVDITDDVTWSSNDTNIATISEEGEVEAIAKGVVTISATTAYNEVANYSITISELVLESVLIDNKTDQIWLYDSKTLTVSVVPATAKDDVVWASSDETVLKIDENGKITAQSTGKATISVTSNYDLTKSDSVEISVVFDPVAVLDTFHIDDPFVKQVTSFSEGSSKVQMVYGSVNLYSNMALNLIDKIIPITNTKYQGMIATRELLTTAEADKIIRTGIKHPSTSYITYHDTGNANAGADAQAHADFMVSDWNMTENRARSWHYTVDENRVIYHIPDNEVTWQGDTYESYSSSIGVETCVDFGSDLAVTWHRTAKLMAQLLIKYDLSYDAIVQHYDWNRKNCPQTLRTANLYSHAIDMVIAEHQVLTLLNGCTISFRSLSPDYLDDRGRVIDQPESALRVSYQVTIKNNKGLNETKVYSSVLKGKDGSSSITLTENETKALLAFDELVAKVPYPVTKSSKTAIEAAQNAYDSLGANLKSIASSKDYLDKLAYDLYALDRVDTKILINEVYCSVGASATIGSGYIELYNATSTNINLDGYKLIIDDTEYLFNSSDVIKANSHYLISSPYYSSGAYLAYADKYINEATFMSQKPNYIKLIDDNANVLDLVGFSADHSYENNYINGNFDGAGSYSRNAYLDTNNNRGDFLYQVPTPYNGKGETIKALSANEITAYLLDLEILSLPDILTLDDKDNVERIQVTFEGLEPTVSNLLRYRLQLELKVEELDGLLNPEMKVINQIAREIPEQIVTDYQFPEVTGISYAFNDADMSNYFDLATGTLLKMSIDTKIAVITISYADVSKEISVNFGILAAGQTAIFTGGTAATAPAFGSATYADKLSVVGFAGYAIIVSNNVYFVGENAFISLDDQASTFLVTELRPFGSSTTRYNQGLIKGVPTATNGGGALYYNSSNSVLSFDISETYGRSGASVYGYGKVIFTPNDDNTYKVMQNFGDSGTNDETNYVVKTMKPGEYLWCPHTFETNLRSGTRLHQGGDGSITAVGVLQTGISIRILEFKFTN